MLTNYLVKTLENNLLFSIQKPNTPELKGEIIVALTVFFKDIYDHLIAINETANMLREVIASTMDTYLSMVSKKLNDVMKFLTVVTVIFMPLNLIAGIGGMSEFTMIADPAAWENPWPWLAPYLILVGLLILTGVGMYHLLKRSKLA